MTESEVVTVVEVGPGRCDVRPLGIRLLEVQGTWDGEEGQRLPVEVSGAVCCGGMLRPHMVKG